MIIGDQINEDGNYVRCHAGGARFKAGLCNVTLIELSCRDHVNYYLDQRPLETYEVSWCEGCINPVDGVLDPTTVDSLVTDNVAMMGPFDLLALLLATFVVALTVEGELKVRIQQRC